MWLESASSIAFSPLLGPVIANVAGNGFLY
jgi:hypothetical protein